MTPTVVAEHASPQRHRTPSEARRRILTVITLMVAFGLGGCSEASRSAPSSTEATPTAAPTIHDEPASTDTDIVGDSGGDPQAAGSAVEDEIVRRYLAFWEARRSANTGIPDPASPALVELATGEQLAVVLGETQRNLDDGVTFQDRPNPASIQRVRVVEVDGDRAQVQECVVDDELVVHRGTGAVVDDAITTHNVVANLERIDGEWRVSAARLVQRWEGIAGCALDS
jgi:hypothetical protein